MKCGFPRGSEILFFLSQMKQRLNDTFIQNWHERLSNSMRANFYKTFASFRIQPYLSKRNVFKYIQATSISTSLIT